MSLITVSPPFNPARLYTAIAQLVGPSGWTFKLGDDGHSIAITLDQSLALSIPALTTLVTNHNTNFLAEEFADNKNRAKDTIDAKAGAVSRKYVTDRTAQDVTYQIKAQSANAWIANGRPLPITRAAYPGLYGDWMARAAVNPTVTVQATVDDILTTQSFWYDKADHIEQVRRTGKLQIDTAVNDIDVVTILTNTMTAFDAL